MADEEQTADDLGQEVGRIKHYFHKIGVAVIELSADLMEGDTIRIKGANTDFIQVVDSMQIDHVKVEEAKAGQSIGMKVKEPVREHDKVYKED